MKLLTVTARSVTVELKNKTPYFANKPFSVLLNGVPLFEEKRNVFSVFSLSPHTTYELVAGDEKVVFTTKPESGCLNVKDFYALGDGVHDDTEAFHAAIACLPKGGTLFVPVGIYCCKPLFLKSDTTLYLDKGAVLLGNPERTNYPILPALVVGNLGGQVNNQPANGEHANSLKSNQAPKQTANSAQNNEWNFGTWQGEEAECFASLLTAIGQKNVQVIGEGTIDCNALAGDWYQNHRVKRIAWRPRGVFFNRCEHVLMQGITVKNTPSWNVHPYFCKDVKLFDLQLQNIESMPTTDGIDPDCCNGVQIVGVNISVGDDCIAIKSGTIDFAKKYQTPCKNIVIRNCLMQKGHGGVVLGSELSGGIENIHVSQCLFDGTDRGLRIKTRRGRGHIGITDGIAFSNILMRGVKVPFVVNMYYNMGDETGHTEYVWTTEKLPVDDRTPFIGSFVFENMVCENVEYAASAFYGLPEAPIKSITLKNVRFTYSETAEAGFADMKEKNEKVKRQGLYFQFVEQVVLQNVELTGYEGEAVICEGVKNIVTK